MDVQIRYEVHVVLIGEVRGIAQPGAKAFRFPRVVYAAIVNIFFMNYKGSIKADVIGGVFLAKHEQALRGSIRKGGDRQNPAQAQACLRQEAKKIPKPGWRQNQAEKSPPH